MATHYGDAIKLSQTIGFTSALPLDNRVCVDKKDDLSTITTAYYGLWTWCMEDQQFYVYSHVNDSDVWVKYEPTPSGQVYVYQKSVTKDEFLALDITKMTPGYVYNVSEEVTIKNSQGVDVTYPAGTNFAWTSEGYWDALSGKTVYDVKVRKSDSEEYQTCVTNGVANIDLASYEVQAIPDASILEVLQKYDMTPSSI